MANFIDPLAILSGGMLVDFPAEDDVEIDVDYASGAATGTLEVEGVTIPTTPTIITSLDGNDITVTIDGDSGATNYLYYKSLGATSWTTTSRSGDGDITLTDVADGNYLLTAVSKVGNVYSLPAIAQITTIDTTEADIDDIYSDAGNIYIDTFGISVTYNPYGGAARTIKAIVDYGGLINFDTGPGTTIKNTISVLDSATSGISRTEFKPGQDTVTIPVQKGVNQTRRLVRIADDSDEDLFIIEIE